MADKAYEYMDWPRIEAIVYGEEASPRDVMQPRVTEDGVLIQGFFPGADAAEVVVGEKSYPMILEDEAGYYAVMLPLKRIPEYRFRVIRGSRKETFYDAYECPCQITEEEERAFCAGVYYKAYEKLGAHPGTCGEVEGTILLSGHPMQSVSVWSVILTGGMEGVFRCIGCQCPEFLRFLFQVYRQGPLTSMRSRSKAAMYSGSLILTEMELRERRL